MGYNPEIYAQLRSEWEDRRKSAIAESETRLRELHTRFPEVAAIDRKLAQAGADVMRAAMTGGNVENAMARLKEENLKLQKQRGDFLESRGYPSDYSDIHYACPICRDTGFDGQKMCSCLRTALVEEGMKRSGVGSLIRTQSFDSFSLKYYQGDPAVLENMKYVLETARAYAENFSAGTSDSLLLLGGTGLGKTHLSSAIAKRLIERGFDVRYDSAQNIFSAFEDEKFRSGYDKSSGRTDGYLECDLLIMDDLGAEMKSQFSAACLYNIINTRINRGKATIVSTNLTQNEIRSRYSDRIASRFFGEFITLVFRGEDIRAQKLKE